MNLKLRLLANDQEQSWTLKPAREYTIGTSPSFDIELTDISVDVNLKFVYDTYSQAWYVSDLSNRGNLTIDGQPLQSHEIRANAKIGIERGVSIELIPEGSSTPTNGHAAAGRSGTATYGGSTSTVERTQQASSSRQKSASEGSKANKKLRRLTWSQYVNECVERGASRFGMVTGYRFTPWLRAVGSLGFNSFDGYIIPDFQQIPGCEKSSQSITSQIQSKLGDIAYNDERYDNTDCFIASITDAHIVDSLTQNIWTALTSVELFPIIRGRRGTHKYDYRDFCIVRYNRVKTYLLVENYGTDLFVSWITRFESESSILPQVIYGIIAFIMFLFISYTYHPFPVRFIPILQWVAVFIGTPRIMEAIGIVPRMANANFVAGCIMIILSLIMTTFSMGHSSGELMFIIWGWIILWIGFIWMMFLLAFGDKSILPLDLVDGKKLDDTVAKQVETVLKPLLESANYTSQQIEQILTRTSLGKIQFRR